MSSKMDVENVCPECKARGMLFVASDQRVTCSLCGYKSKPLLDDVTGDAPDPDSDEPRDKYPITFSVQHPGGVDRWSRSFYESGLAYVKRGDYAAAVRSFRRALDGQSDFVDVHLWLARLTDDPDAKREHYGVVLAYLPNNGEAVREMMVLNGQITREEADRAARGETVQTRAAPVPVEAVAPPLVCGVCGGEDFAINDESRKATCKFCGNTQDLPQYDQQKGYGIQSVQTALIKRSGQGVAWTVGERVIHCQHCGAERIIGADKMTTRCPFCASRNVIEQDALQTLEQPDGLLPFLVKREAAEGAINKALNSHVERLKGLFGNNRVASGMMTGVYMPFWIFDAMVNVSVTREDKQAQRMTRQSLATIQQTRSEASFGDTMHDIPIPAVTSPPPRLLQRLGRFDLKQVVAYDRHHLGEYGAELYTVDYDKASLQVAPIASKWMKTKHMPVVTTQDEEVRVSTLVTRLDFRLVLMPVWVAILREADGDVRMGLVNGQSGQVALSRARKGR